MAQGGQPDVFGSSVIAAQVWLKEIQDLADNHDPHLAYHALRATLHALRDRIPAGAGAHFAAQLPTLLRGVFYENWKPDHAPKTVRDREAFLDLIRSEYQYPKDADLEYLSAAVFETINHQVSRDLAVKTRRLLNAELQELWPEPSNTFQATPGQQQAPPPEHPLESGGEGR